jgi:protein SCO1/2
MKLGFSIGLLLLVHFAAAQSFLNSPTGVSTSTTDSEVKVVQTMGAQVPSDAHFLDQNSRSVTMGELSGKKSLIVLPMFYRCKGACTLEFENLLGAIAKETTLKAGRDFDVVILGIDPVEGPDLAKGKFSETQKEFPNLISDEGWHFLTGDLNNIRRVTDALGFFYKYDAEKDLINHPTGIMFVSPPGVVSSYILDPEQYTSAGILKGVQTAEAHKVGAKAQEAFFGCVHIDPLTGKRSLVFEKVLRLAGVVFLVVAAAGIAFLSRKRTTH